MKPYLHLLVSLALLLNGPVSMAGDQSLATLEADAENTVLQHFIHTLQKSQNFIVFPNPWPSEKNAEQAQFGEDLARAIKFKNGEGISLPKPQLSSGRDGHEVVLQRIRELTQPCASTDKDKHYVDGIPRTLLNDLQYPRLFSFYKIDGDRDGPILMERRFHDPQYKKLQSTQWLRFFEGDESIRKDHRTCLVVAGNSADIPPGKDVENFPQSGILQFQGKVVIYKTSIHTVCPEKEECVPMDDYFKAHPEEENAPPPDRWIWMAEISFPDVAFNKIFGDDADESLPFFWERPMFYTAIFYGPALSRSKTLKQEK